MGQAYSCGKCDNVATIKYIIDIPEKIHTSVDGSKYEQWRGMSMYLDDNWTRTYHHRCDDHKIPSSDIPKECKVKIIEKEQFNFK